MTIQIFDACITGLAMVSHGASAAGLRHWIKTQVWYICKLFYFCVFCDFYYDEIYFWPI